MQGIRDVNTITLISFLMTNRIEYA
jgi:hypothetical protein